MYGQDILCGITKGVFFIKLKFEELLDIRAHMPFKMPPANTEL